MNDVYNSNSNDFYLNKLTDKEKLESINHYSICFSFFSHNSGLFCYFFFFFLQSMRKKKETYLRTDEVSNKG